MPALSSTSQWTFGHSLPAMNPKTRRARHWQRRIAPPWTDMVRGRERRRAFFSYWRTDGLLNLLDYTLFTALGLLPPQWAADCGGLITDRLVRPRVPELVSRVRKNLARIRPELSEAERERLLRDYYMNKGRVFGEFPVLAKVYRTGKIETRGGDLLRSLHAEGKGLIIVGLHLANWEIGSAAITDSGLPFKSFYEPPAREGQHKLALKVRDALGGLMFPPGKAGARFAVRELRNGGVLSVFGDEGLGGKCMAPFFGREPHLDGNLAIAARLARLSGAPVVYGYGARKKNGEFLATFDGPIVLPSRTRPDVPLIEDVRALNDVIEPLIRSRCSEWFFLDHEI